MMGGVGDPKLYDAYYKAIAECCDYAAEKAVTISVKPHGPLNGTGPECRGTAAGAGASAWKRASPANMSRPR